MSGRTELQVTTFTGSRGDLALQLLRVGRAVWLDDVLMQRDTDGTWEASVPVRVACHPHDLISEARSTLVEFAAESTEFTEMVRGQPIGLTLIADYEHGRVTLQRFPAEIVVR